MRTGAGSPAAAVESCEPSAVAGPGLAVVEPPAVEPAESPRWQCAEPEPCDWTAPYEPDQPAGHLGAASLESCPDCGGHATISEGDACQYQNNFNSADKARSREARRRANPPQKPAEHAPKYTHACHENRWTMNLRHVEGRVRGKTVPFRCRSRHHVGPCRDDWRAQLFARLTSEESRMMACHPGDAMFWTLTLDSGWHRRVSDSSRFAANKLLGAQLHRFMEAINARLRRLGLPRAEYFWVREDHRSGVPHVHLVVISPFLAKELRDRDTAAHQSRPDDRTLAPPHWVGPAVLAGWGPRFDAQIAENRDALTGYVTKVCTELDDREVLAGEVSKGRQTPEMLPRNCRSYGSTRGFMPPKNKSGEWTGWLENEDGEAIGQRNLDPETETETIVERFDRLKAKARAPHPVFDSENELAFFEDASSAHAFAVGEQRGPGFTRVARKYVLRNDDWKFTRNPRAFEGQGALFRGTG